MYPHMMTRVYLLIAMLAAAISISSAQNKISGTVYDESGNTLTGATVALAKTFKGTITDTRGNYLLDGLDKGSYEIVVSFVGFESHRQSITADGMTTVDFQLKKAAFMTDDILVTAIRAGEKTPTSFTNFSKEEIEAANFGQDIPFILEFTPSAVATSDAGAGVGYTGIRIRGSDNTRTNVTINGIPVNDSESHGVFWVNMPDFASSVDNIQIQRGVGTSTNGAAAFGASINMQTDGLIEKPYAEINTSFGTFNTLRNSVKAGTGLINDRFTMDMRLSRIQSDGFIDRASSDLRSFYLAGAYYGKKDVLRFNVFSGKEVTYQAWNGVSEALLRDGNRTFNSAGRYIDANGMERFHDNEVDDYQQDHYQMHYSRELSRNLSFNTSLHYTRGRGFFEQYRHNDRFSTYGLQPVTLGGSQIRFSSDSLVTDQGVFYNPNPGEEHVVTVGGETINRTDLIRRRWLDNHFYGLVGTLQYNDRKGLEITTGWGWNTYEGAHFGEVIWANRAPQLRPGDRYYDNDATKRDFHFFAKTNYQLTNKLNAFADLQIRGIQYEFEGLAVLNEETVITDQSTEFLFFNPKLGLYYDIDSRQAIYSSLSVGNREPVRRDFTESTPESRPTHETLYNVETGYKYRNKTLLFQANYFLMLYRNQLVLTGQINDVGAYTRTNIDDSYRTGLELEAAWRPTSKWQLGGNMSFSQNRIRNFTEFVDDFSTGAQIAIEHSNTDIAFSPGFIAGGELRYTPSSEWQVSILPKYVGRQFLDNTSNADRSLSAYFINNLRIHHSLSKKSWGQVDFGLLVYNLLDTAFESNGYTFSYFWDGSLVTENFYYPQAGRHFLASVTLSF
jgi:iron complex outermembrane recepter protein